MPDMRIQISPDLKIVAGQLSMLSTQLLQRIMEPAAQDAAPIIENAIREEVPVRTGAGQDSIQAVVELGGAGRSARIVITGAGHLIYVLGGTKPHPIDPINSKLLAWVGEDGTLTFAKHVDHPGQAANPFVERAWAVAQPEISQSIRAEGLRAWKDLAHFK